MEKVLTKTPAEVMESSILAGPVVVFPWSTLESMTRTAIKELARQCRFEFYRASGPGGQHRNKVETGVRAIHIPTGVQARASERRSREMNRGVALERLAHRLEARARTRAPRIPTLKSAAVRQEELASKKRISVKKHARREIER